MCNNIRRLTVCSAMAGMLMLLPGHALAGVLGEYSFLHVTFDSVWHVFLFIFTLVMVPFALIIVLSWRFRDRSKAGHAGEKPPRRDVARENGQSE